LAEPPLADKLGKWAFLDIGGETSEAIGDADILRLAEASILDTCKLMRALDLADGLSDSFLPVFVHRTIRSLPDLDPISLSMTACSLPLAVVGHGRFPQIFESKMSGSDYSCADLQRDSLPIATD
jgi:hypothetical protein